VIFIYERIGGYCYNEMRYINLRFTYLLTLLTQISEDGLSIYYRAVKLKGECNVFYLLHSIQQV